jgi:LPS export ABC transporter protein LptC
MDKRKNKGKGKEISSHPPVIKAFRSIVFLLLAGSSMLFSCQKNDVEVIRSLTRVDTLPTQTVHNLTTIYMDTGRLQMIITAPLVYFYNDREEPVMIFPQGLNVDFYNREMVAETHLSAHYAIYYKKKELWEARDSVIAENINHERLDAEILFWDVGKKLIYTDKYIQITTPDEVIFGEGFESDQAFTDWKIKKVKGTVYFEEPVEETPEPGPVQQQPAIKKD